MRLPSVLVALAVAAAAAAQSVTVSTTADSGAGSLRAALNAANASPAATFTIDVAASATAGPIRLTSNLPPLTRSNVTIRPLAGAGRLVIDAAAGTTAAGFGLRLDGNGIQILVPCRVLSGLAHGVLVYGAGARVQDLEAIGNRGGFGLAATGADDLVVGRLFVDTFAQGLILQNCRRAHVADDGVSVAECRNCTGPAIAINGGSDHSIGSFVCAAGGLGVSAMNSPALHLGRAGSPRASVTGCQSQGILLSQCSGALLTNADVTGNGTAGGMGIQVIGGSGFAASNLLLQGNSYGGLLVEGGASNARIGPGVQTRGIVTGQDIGLIVRAATAVTVVDCTFGPDHRFGARLEPDTNGAPSGVTFCRCTISRNRETGLSLSTSTNTLVCSSTVTGSLGEGISAVGASLATGPHGVVIADCDVSGNSADGVVAQNVSGIQVGPGNRVDDNVFTGVLFSSCTGTVIRDNRSIDRNRDRGIWIQDCDDCVVRDTPLSGNRVCGIYALGCARLAVGPDVAVRDTLGTGIELEGADACRVVSTQLTNCSTYGMHIVAAAGYPGTNPHVLQSCLLADHPGLGLMVTSGPPVICQLCTIAGNFRGVDSGSNPVTIDSCIVWGNAFEDLQRTATGLTVRSSFQLNPPPAASSGNTAADPMFVAPALHDWRLQAASPAIGRANAALAPAAAGLLDAWNGPRGVGALDAGAYEVGPHVVPTATRLSLASPAMAHGGGGLSFSVQYPPWSAGMLSILCLQLGTPAGSFAAFGAVVPLASTPELLLAATDTGSAGTLAVIPADGRVSGALLWAGTIPLSWQGVEVSLCAVALDGTPMIRAVSNTATFTIQ